jgi:hypothetical protein
LPRSSLLLLLAIPPLAAERAAAQGFEGTVTMTITSTTAASQSNDITMKMATRGDRSVTTITMGSSAGIMAGMEVRTIIDRNANTVTTLTPLPPGMPMPSSMTGGVNAKGFKMVTPFSGMGVTGGRASDVKPEIRSLGTSETIVGLSCEDFEITMAGSTPYRACITRALGTFTYPMSGRGMTGGRGGGASSSPEWARAFGDKPAFPLKVWHTDGKVALQVTAIDKSPVAESAFEIPEGFVTMPGRGG